jgi:predicted Zn-dependent peptidase
LLSFLLIGKFAALFKSMELLLHTLPNGIRIVHQRTNGMIAHCGLIINKGSRDEALHQHGIVHFIEHMLFKGTSKRKAYHILSSLDDTGGELNAYTTKEETAIHASVLKENYEKAINVISDITFNSTFPEKEIEKEKDVIIEEINSYRDNPGELIFDDFEEMVFSKRPLGRNILGTPESVKSITRKMLRDFVHDNYNPGEMVFCSVGNIPDEKVIKLSHKYLSSFPSLKKKSLKNIKWSYKPAFIEKKLDTWQTHCMTGNIAYSVKDKKRLGMFLLNNILGGHGLNSRLNLSLRENRGLAYQVESNYNPYSDAGIFSVYFGTDKQNLDKSRSVVRSELDKLRNTKLGTIQLSRAKNQIKGYLARGYENHESLMLSLGKSLMVFNRIDSPEEICIKIDNISSSQLLEIANEVFEPSALSTLIFK